MKSSAKTGAEGEKLAADYLQTNGYLILERNYRYRRSEVDIIAKKSDLLIFVEVKTKSYVNFGYPEEAVNEVKVKKVLEAADNYTYVHSWQKDIRFDIIAINASTGQIKHFIDAFY